MSMISKQIKALRDVALAYSHNGIGMILKQAADTIEELSAKLANSNMERSTAYYNNGWIPCSERLPEERDWYLAVFQEPDTGFIGLPYIADYLLGQHTNYTTNEGWIIKDCTDFDGACEYYKDLMCVAWQPLPESYK